MNSQRNPLLLIATALLLRLQGIWSVCSVSRCPGLHLDSAVFPLRQGKSLPEHCFPQTKKKPNVNTPEILKHCCLPCGSPCSGVWLYNALHRNEECTAAFNSLPVDSLHIFLQETQPFLYLFFPIPSMQQINPIWGSLQALHWHFCLNFYSGLSPWHLCLFSHSFWFVLSSITVVFHGLLWWLRW